MKTELQQIRINEPNLLYQKWVIYEDGGNNRDHLSYFGN